MRVYDEMKVLGESAAQRRRKEKNRQVRIELKRQIVIWKRQRAIVVCKLKKGSAMTAKQRFEAIANKQMIIKVFMLSSVSFSVAVTSLSPPRFFVHLLSLSAPFTRPTWEFVLQHKHHTNKHKVVEPLEGLLAGSDRPTNSTKPNMWIVHGYVALYDGCQSSINAQALIAVPRTRIVSARLLLHQWRCTLLLRMVHDTRIFYKEFAELLLAIEINTKDVLSDDLQKYSINTGGSIVCM